MNMETKQAHTPDSDSWIFLCFGAYGAYGTYGTYGAYGAYETYGTYGAYGAYESYGAYGQSNMAGHQRLEPESALERSQRP